MWIRSSVTSESSGGAAVPSPAPEPEGVDREHAFLHARHALQSAGGRETTVRYGIAALTLMFGVLGAVSMFTPDGSAGSPPRMIAMAIIATSTVPFAVLVSQMSLATAWWSKTGRLRGMNNSFAIYADVGLASALATFQSPVLVLAASSLFGVVGGYVANFVHLRIVIVHMVFSTTTIVTTAAFAVAQGVGVATAGYLALVALTSANGLVLLLRNYSLSFKRALQIQLDYTTTDPLTGVLNRRGFTAAMAGVAARPGRPFAVVMIDIDHYKSINDRYGHAVGDAVLTRLAQRIRSTAGPDAVVGRLGGDEFAIAAQLGHDALERMARRLSVPASGLVGGRIVTMSVGAVCVDPLPPIPRGEADSFLAEYLNQADTALLSAKHAGRNTYVVVTADTEQASETA
ncbi:GGDEF domain-containing protein [Gordonia sp. VNQ95]|jgi:diguanylate cyclase (GGDEF)-like protein